MNEMSSYVENLFSKKTNFMVSKSFPQTMTLVAKYTIRIRSRYHFFDSNSGPEFVEIEWS